MNEIATLLGRSDLNRIQDLGYAVIDPFLQSHVCDELSQQLEALAPSGSQRRGGVRDLFVCSPATCALVRSAPIRELVVTNSLPLREEQKLPNLKLVTIAPLLGEAIRRIHRNESVSYLFD